MEKSKPKGSLRAQKEDDNKWHMNSNIFFHILLIEKNNYTNINTFVQYHSEISLKA